MSTASTIRLSRTSRKLLFQSRPRLSSGIFASRAKDLVKESFAEPGQDLDRFLREVVDACASNVAVLDESGTILYASRAWRLFEKEKFPDRPPHNRLPDYFDDCRRLTRSSTREKANATLAADIQRIIVGEEREFHRKYCYYGSTEPQHFVTHAARLNLPGSAFRVLVTHDDHLVAIQALSKSEARLSQLLETTKILVWEADAESRRFTYVSKQAVDMLGYPIAQWYEPNFLASHTYREDKQRALSFCRKHSQLDHRDITFRMLARNGRIVWLQNLIDVTYENGKPAKLRGFMVDISARKQAEEASQALGRRLIAAQEEERRRVARELHDDLNQRMALLSIELEQLAQGAQKALNLRGPIRKLQKQAQEISADIHRISYELHPAKLDHLGLGPAVRSLCKEISEGQNLKIDLEQTGFPATLPKDVTLCAFRIVQEALRNCVKHSGAHTVRVVLERTEAAVRLAISDDGCGFDMESDATRKGLGFISMRERLHLLSGDIRIHSRPFHGTRINVAIPLVSGDSGSNQ